MLNYIARQASLPPAEPTASSASCESDSTRVVTSQDRTGAGCASGRQAGKEKRGATQLYPCPATNLNQPFFWTPSNI